MDEIDLEDLLGLVSFLVLTGKAPRAGDWVEEFVDARLAEVNEDFANNFF